MMSEHPINDLMQTSMQKLREMVDVNTIVGHPDGRWNDYYSCVQGNVWIWLCRL